MLRRATLALVVITLAAGFAAAAEPAAGVVNINTAAVDQLSLLPRIGPALAQRIIDFRTANGAFASPDELVAVKGIGERMLEGLKPYVTVKGDTTLTDKVRSPRRAHQDEGQAN
jgi:competence protein ComEA